MEWPHFVESEPARGVRPQISREKLRHAGGAMHLDYLENSSPS